MSSIQANGGDTISIADNGGTIQYKVNNGSFSSLSFPVLVTNLTPGSGTLTVLFTTDLTLTSTSHYFDCQSTNIQFGSSTRNSDGTRPTITISGVTNYVGLISNGSSGANGYNSVSIYNLIVTTAGGTTQGTDGGWIGRTSFSKGASNNLIVNCSSTGAIRGGGIVGAYSANGGSLTIRGCTSTGSISSSCGGILGYNCAGSSGSSVTIDRCSSTGTIGSNGGGIVGNSCGINGGSVSVTNSYSAGSIAAGAGGIFGASAGSAGTTSATRCYSTGVIVGGGGIFGSSAGATFGSPGSATASNCFTTGAITSGGGGIFGSAYTTAPAYNCYTTGSLTGVPNGGIYQNSLTDNLQGANNYAEGNHSSSGWKDSNAKPYLIGDPVLVYGSVWSQPDGSNTPFVLSSSGYTPYSTSLTTSYSVSVVAGNTTESAVITGYTHSILEINGDTPSSFPYLGINSSTGALSASSSTPADTYTLYIYSTINPYSITELTLTVSEAPGSEGSTSVTCCQRTMNLEGLDYETRNKLITGNTMIPETRRTPYASYDFFYYSQKMALAAKR